MARLIDADMLKGELYFLYKMSGWDSHDIHFSLSDMEMNIDLIPTLDIPIVIRCKDCKWYLKANNKGGWCSFSQRGYPEPDEYCSWAERRTDETD